MSKRYMINRRRSRGVKLDPRYKNDFITVVSLTVTISDICLFTKIISLEAAYRTY